MATPESQDLVRIEKSLQSIGFFSSTAKRQQESAQRMVTQVVKHADGRRIQAKAVISAPQDLGLPTTADRDKYMALMKIIMDRRTRGAVSNPIRFSGYELLKTLRLSFAGQHYDEINEWLRRMTATTIMSESIVFLADRKEYATDIFHVFDQVTLYGQEMADGTRAENYEVHLSRWQLQNINAGFLLQIDLNAYLELRRDISKALFGHLHVWFYASRGRTVEKHYPDFCQLLHIKVWPHLSKIKQILQPSMEELVAIGYLSSWDVVREASGRDYKVVLSPGPRLMATPALSSVSNAQMLPPAAPAWVAQLVERGVLENVARQLALDVDEEQPVEEQIRYVDRILSEAPTGKFRNPPGMYVSFIRDNVPVPLTSTAPVSAERTDKYWQQVELDRQYEEFCWQQVKAHLEQRAAEPLYREDLRRRSKSMREAYPQLPEETITEMAWAQWIRDRRPEVSLPSKADFARRTRQKPLFGKPLTQ